MSGCAASDSLNCPNETSDCIDECQQIAQTMGCETEGQAMVQCVGALSASDFTCDADGEATTDECAAESLAYISCILGGTASAGTNASGGGTGGGDATGCDSCIFAMDDDCDEPDFCEPGTDCTDCGS